MRGNRGRESRGSKKKIMREEVGELEKMGVIEIRRSRRSEGKSWERK